MMLLMTTLACLFVFWNNRIDDRGTAKLAATISIVNAIFESGLSIENDPSWSKQRRECANQVHIAKSRQTQAIVVGGGWLVGWLVVAC
jgi:hypothetical protein